MTEPGTRIRVLLVDDHAVLREGVASVLGRQPDMPGAQVIRELSRDYAEARFVVLTTYDTQEDAYRAFAAGAAAYLLKGAGVQEIVGVIRAAHAGQRLIPPGVQDLLAHERLHVDLTARERDVLRLLAEGWGNRDIARALGISSETVKTHLDRMRAKLDAPDRAALVAKALRLGLIGG